MESQGPDQRRSGSPNSGYRVVSKNAETCATPSAVTSSTWGPSFAGTVGSVAGFVFSRGRTSAARIRDGSELWPGTGNRETIRNQVFSRDPLVWFAIRTHRGRRRRIAAMLARPEYAHLAVHRFRVPREAEGWLEARRTLTADR